MYTCDQKIETIDTSIIEYYKKLQMAIIIHELYNFDMDCDGISIDRLKQMGLYVDKKDQEKTDAENAKQLQKVIEDYEKKKQEENKSNIDLDFEDIDSFLDFIANFFKSGVNNLYELVDNIDNAKENIKLLDTKEQVKLLSLLNNETSELMKELSNLDDSSNINSYTQNKDLHFSQRHNKRDFILKCNKICYTLVENIQAIKGSSKQISEVIERSIEIQSEVKKRFKYRETEINNIVNILTTEKSGVKQQEIIRTLTKTTYSQTNGTN